MRVATFAYELVRRRWSVSALPALDSPQTMVLAFGAPELVGHPGVFQALRRAYPRSHLIGCSSAGEIAGTEVRDGTLSVAVARFERTEVAQAAVLVRAAEGSREAGRALAEELRRPDLRALLVLSEGLKINGSELVRGINSVVDDSVVVTGGLAGDGERFERTWVCSGNRLQSGLVAAVGLYGDRLVVGHGSKGGWDKFGPERIVTRADGNVLYELDGEPALDLYQRYLGDKAAGLPATGLLFPLALREREDIDKFLVRTVLSVDGEARSLTFAGDVPVGYRAQLMKADFERLIGGAEGAALMARDVARQLSGSVLNVAISCVGRRLVLGDRIDEELEAVQGVLPPGTHTTGFYSYGEISPYATGHCDLHNQTMTLTVFGERGPDRSRAVDDGGRAATRVTHPYGSPTLSAAGVGSIVVRPPAMRRAPRNGDAGADRGGSAPAAPRAVGPVPPLAVKPATKPAVKPATRPAVKPVAKPIVKPAVKSASAPSEEPAADAAPAAAEAGGVEVATLEYDLDRRRWSVPALPAMDSPTTLVLVFGAPEARAHPEVFEQLARQYRRSHMLGCSSAGEIAGAEVRDRSLSVAIARFRHTRLAGTAVMVGSTSGSRRAGKILAQRLNRPDLRAVLVLSEGLAINGSELVSGINEELDESVIVTGGLAGDGTRFERTWIFCGDRLRANVVAAVGLYGDHLIVGHGSKGGWDKFGPERVVTRSDGNVLYELDGTPALALYKQYLGDKASGLPSTALLFPLALRARDDDDKHLVRTVLSVDEAAQSMTFAGDVPIGYRAQLMKADFQRLVGGAEGAALMARGVAGHLDAHGAPRGLNIAISCVGRRIVLGDRTEEELEAVRDVLPAGTATVGFYSYGEISPYASGQCDLHNQTMTLTYLSEAPVAIAATARQAARAAAATAWRDGRDGGAAAHVDTPALREAAAVDTPALRAAAGGGDATGGDASEPPDIAPSAELSAWRTRGLARGTGDLPGPGADSAGPAPDAPTPRRGQPSVAGIAGRVPPLPSVRLPDAPAARDAASDHPADGSPAPPAGAASDPGVGVPALSLLTVSSPSAALVVRTSVAPGGDPEPSPDGGGLTVATFRYDLDAGAFSISPLPALDSPRTLVLAFGAPALADHPDALGALSRAFPSAHIAGCSAAGQIAASSAGVDVRDRSLVVAVARFSRTALATTTITLGDASRSYAAGQALASELGRPDLRAMLVLAGGPAVDGGELVRGINDAADASVVIAGGLAGDGAGVERTWLLSGDRAQPGGVVAVGLYGDDLVIGNGSGDGWDRFGPERAVTRSRGNVLYELDDQPALPLYRRQLGARPADVPAAGLLFPLSLRGPGDDGEPLVRAPVAVDERTGAMTFSGDVPEGYRAQLMRADAERLIRGARSAGMMARGVISGAGGDPWLHSIGDRDSDVLAVAISCAGRRLVLGDRARDEVAAVNSALPHGAHTVGFYAHGAISPFATGHCDLHTQTMTLTVMSEKRTPFHPGYDGTMSQTMPRAPTPRAATPHDRQPGAGEPGPERRPARAPSLDALPPPPLGSLTPPPLDLMTPGVQIRDYRPVTVTNLRAGADLHVCKRVVGDVSVFELSGRINESFLGRELARELAGSVVFDLAGVERITSYGVREWLHMIADAEPHIRELYLARCSEAVVNQLIMVRGLAGAGHIVSFEAPYVCSACSHAFGHLIDCEADADAIRGAAPPDITCTRCTGAAFFDDEARSYLVFALPHAGRAIPARIRDALTEASALSQASSTRLDAVQKSVEGERTVVRINTALDDSIRWFRVLDGVEGVLRVDLEGVTSATDAGLTAFGMALQSIQTEVDRVEIERCPTEVARYIGQTPALRVSVLSAYVPAICRECGLQRAALVDVAGQRDVLAAGGKPTAVCKRCNHLLAFDSAADVLVRVVRRGHKARDRGLGQPLRAEAPRPPRAASRLPGILAVGAVVGAALVGAIWFGMRMAGTRAEPGQPPGARSESPAPAPGAARGGQAQLPPAWTERGFVIDGAYVYVVGRGGPVGDPASAIGAASRDAIRVILDRVAPRLEGSRLYDLLRARADERIVRGGGAPGAADGADAAEVARAVKRYHKQVGQFATPERIDVHLEDEGDGAVATVHYRMAARDFDRIVEFYKASTELLDFVVVPRFPGLYGGPDTGDLIVAHVAPGSQAEKLGLASGDTVIKVAGRYVTSIQEYEQLMDSSWRAISPGEQLEIEVESAGGRRVLSFRK